MGGFACVVVVALVACSAPEPADEPSPIAPPALVEMPRRDGAMAYVFNAPESQADRRYDYQWEILRTALERTVDRYGPFVMVPAIEMSENRQAAELQHASGKLTVMYLGTTPEFERTLTPIRIPVDKNLGGYCVFLIRAKDRARYAAVRTLDELRELSIGQGLGWLDVDILRASHFDVVTGSSYDGLFDMLANHRFDGFLRAAVEILGEYDVHHPAIPELAIEDTLMLYYPLPMYFWFAKNPEGERLAERARVGMFEMIDDGTYDRIFTRFHAAEVDLLHLPTRRVFEIPNPNVGPETPFADSRLWFDPRVAP